MARRIIVLSLLVSVFLIYNVAGVRSLSPVKQLEPQNKLPVKTITTEHGDVYDCIDFYEQPAFDHPLLKNHDYHFNMKPSFVPNGVKIDENDKVRNGFKLNRIGCPIGTVPIRRTTGEVIVDVQADNNPSQKIFAGTATTAAVEEVYGASSYLSIENPRVYSISQYSSSMVAIDGGDEFLHAGWTVHLQLYRDGNTRLFVCVHAARASCYNIQCPGFVITNPSYALDTVLRNSTERGPNKWEIKITIYQDIRYGNWWVALGEKNILIGFWPKSLFNELSGTATTAYFGGVVTIPPSTRYPQMGTGRYPRTKDDIEGSAFCRQVSLINQNGHPEYIAYKCSIYEPLMKSYIAHNIDISTDASASTIIFGGH